MISKVILDQLIGKNIKPIEDFDQRKIDECNKLINELTNIYDEIKNITNEPHLTHDCVFLGLPQVLFILKNSMSHADFIHKLRTYKTSIVSGYDTYRSLHYIFELQKKSGS